MQEPCDGVILVATMLDHERGDRDRVRDVGDIRPFANLSGDNGIKRHNFRYFLRHR
jgi:hypothetical protein